VQMFAWSKEEDVTTYDARDHVTIANPHKSASATLFESRSVSKL